ncbi:MAG: IS21 family transposase [Pseudomonadota bacterium]|mgnify:FL=1
MRKIKEVLRLHSMGLSQRQIALSCSAGQSTVSDYLQAAEAAGLRWPEVSDWGEERLWETLAPSRGEPRRRSQSPEPDYASLRQELQTNKHVTLQLLWQEYREKHPDGYRYSRFCDLYRAWLGRQEVVLRQDHRAGEKLFVDYAGATIPIQDPATGEARQAAIFVAVLGASNYTYSEASWTQGLGDWIGAHLRTFEFFGGVPEIVVPDNLKSGVTKACRYEPGVNRTYEEMAAHYGVAVVPARPAKPRDKAKVEAGVLMVERWILAALRKRKFFRLAEVNQAIAELLTRLNDRPFRKREGSRRSLFESLDQPALRALPVERYQYGDWETHRVNIDYHVAFDHHWYSVPYQLTGQEVEVRATAATLEIFHRGLRVASHARSSVPHRATTVTQHRPKSHQKHLEWTPSRMVEWAQTIGPATAAVFDRILAGKPHPEQGYRSCLGILRLSQQYPKQRVEAAARRAVALKACSYQSVKSILQCHLDSLPVEPAPEHRPPLDHPNIRGAEYFDTGEEPTLQ